MIRWMLFLLAMLLAACGAESPVGDADVAVGDLNAHVAAPTVAEVLARGDDSVAATPAPVGFDHRGAWAATPALCRGGAWRFAADGVETGDGRCRTTRTETISATSTRLTMTCRADGIETIENWALNLHDDRSMTVSRSEGGDGIPRSVTLRRCG